MSAHWETGASSGVQTISPADLKLYLGWLDFLISTRVLHMNILINDEYSRMLHILLNLQYTICLNFYLVLRFGGLKQNKGIFLLFLKLFRLVLFLQGIKNTVFSCEIIIHSSFLLILLYIYVFINLSKNRFFVYFLSTVADGEWGDDVILHDATTALIYGFALHLWKTRGSLERREIQ